ncbi:hypothetical protein [Thiobacter aerophilum]|uniref:DUF3108 domain-containing protein n=1 Tax=Thiobacter aerophilum TaxID=3121275 RepID=A0ABV0EK68_9BURK
MNGSSKTARTILRGLAALIVVCCASPLAALALPVPPAMEGIDAVDIAQSLRINGVPTRVRVFATDKPLAAVLAFYRTRFGARRVETTLKGWTVVSQRQGDLLYTARLRKALRGTEGTVSVSDLKAGLAHLGRPLGLGLPAGSKLAVDVEMTDPGKRARVVTITNDHSVETNAAFFRAELQSRGYRVERDLPVQRAGTQGRSLWFAAANREAILVVSALASGTSVVLNLIETTDTER